MEKHKAIILGKKVRKVFTASWYSLEILEDTELIERVSLFDGEIDNPPIEVGEKVYIEKHNKSFTVKDKSRNVDGGYVYYTDFVVETVIDEKTEQSKLEAQEELTKPKEDYRKQVKRELQNELIKSYSERNIWLRILNKF